MKGGHAEIVGAGFGGLVSAIAFAERGWTVRVNERRDTLRGEGYGIAIHNNMARIFAGFGILERVLAGGMRIDRRNSLDRARPRGDDAARPRAAPTASTASTSLSCSPSARSRPARRSHSIRRSRRPIRPAR